jgi:hypothetical protein
MSDCAAQTFTSITSDQFNCLVLKAQANGINISGNSGTASKDGITITWNFDPTAETLTLQCTGKPFFVSCGTINSEIHTLVDGCTGS